MLMALACMVFTGTIALARVIRVYQSNFLFLQLLRSTAC